MCIEVDVLVGFMLVFFNTFGITLICLLEVGKPISLTDKQGTLCCLNM